MWCHIKPKVGAKWKGFNIIFNNISSAIDELFAFVITHTAAHTHCAFQEMDRHAPVDAAVDIINAIHIHRFYFPDAGVEIDRIIIYDLILRLLCREKQKKIPVTVRA